MKVLLILYGHYRTFEKTVLAWLSSLEGCDIVYKFVTFDTIDHSTKCWWHDNIEEQPKLTDKQIQSLKILDPNSKILTQVFSNEELNDIYATLPLKVFMYKYNNIKSILESIDEKDYEMIIISRFDILIKNIKFKDVLANANEIKIGYRGPDNSFFMNVAATDLLCAFHPSNKFLFYNIPDDIINRKLKFPEECYTDFYFKNFEHVNTKWSYYTDFEIQK